MGNENKILLMAKKVLLVASMLAAFSAMLFCPGLVHGAERDYQFAWCDRYGGEAEFLLGDRTRVDCLLLGKYAIEFDFAHKWAEAIGQSMLYASRTETIAGVVLIMESDRDCKYLDRLRESIAFGGVGIVIWQTGPHAYQCPP